MVTKFTRSTEYPFYPQIYNTFMAKDLESDELVEYYIEDLTEKHFDQAIELMVQFLMPEESFSKAAKIPGNEKAIEGFKYYYTQVFNEKLSLACFKMSNHEMVGVNGLIVEARGMLSKIEVTMKKKNFQFIF